MKIGITGIAGGGKTVFLTTLLWHLEEMAGERFSLGNHLKLDAFQELEIQHVNGKVFPYQDYREALALRGVWPKKTTDCYHYACSYKRSDWKRFFSHLKRRRISAKQKLEFFDFPGERTADAAIAAFPKYRYWSEHILKHFSGHQDYKIATQAFLKLQDKYLFADSAEESRLEHELIHSYKLALAGLIHGFKPLVSPSSFMLDSEGDVAQPLSDEALASMRITGLDSENQFVPLSTEICDKFPTLAKEMAQRYRQYRQKLAVPIFKEIGKSKSLVILVDIPALLAGGVGRYNDNRQIMLDLFDTINPKSKIGKAIRSLQIWRGLKRVAFVASKADLVRPDDIRNNNLLNLLKEMTIRTKSKLAKVEVQWFVCSALYSTRPGQQPDTIIGQPTKNNPEKKEREFSIPALPNNWPEDWQAGEFPFCNVSPKASKNLQIPPKHLGLDRLFSFLIGE